MKTKLAVLLVFVFVLAVSPVAAADKPTVTLWSTGSQNVSDLFVNLIESYNARPESTAVVELQFILSGTGEDTLSSRIAAAYKTGKSNTGFDMIAENSTSMQGYIDEAGSEDLFQDLDFSKIPNYENILIKPSIYENKFVPYRGTTVIMAYDSARDSGLKALDASHLFGLNTTRLGLRRGTYLRRFEYEFIELFAPQLGRKAVDMAMAGTGNQDEYQL